MKIVDSFLFRLSNGATAWFAPDKQAPADAVILEFRPMLIPENGLFLRHKETGDVSSGHWLRDGDSADKWEETEEIEEPKEV